MVQAVRPGALHRLKKKTHWEENRVLKKIALSMLSVALISALIGGATMALFRATASNPNNVFAAGVVDINLDPAGPGGIFSPPGEALGPMAPGDQGQGTIMVRNVGNLDVFVAYDDANASCTGVLCEVLELTVTDALGNPAGTVVLAPGEEREFRVQYNLPLTVGDPSPLDPDGTRYMGATAEYTAAFKAVQHRNNVSPADPNEPISW